MEISKTLFKEFSKCSNYYYLNNIYKLKGSNQERDKKEETSRLLNKMFNEDGDDLITITDSQLENMLPYYQLTEQLGLQEASIFFSKEFKYEKDTMKQKKFAFTDEYQNTIYTYLDGFHEDNDEIIVLEVKATTSRKFLELGPKEDGVVNPVFENVGNIIRLKGSLAENQLKHLEKIYDKNHEVGQYFYDFAITRYIMNESLKTKASYTGKKIKYYLLCLNSGYVYGGQKKGLENDYFSGDERLFCLIECNQILTNYASLIYDDYQKILSNLKNEQLVSRYLLCCKECLYEKICFERLNKSFSIKTLLQPKRVGQESLLDLINKGYNVLTDIPKSDLEKVNHIIQREAIEDNQEKIEYEQIISTLKEIRYPIYHLDFESLFIPIPRFHGERPYTQSVFQFSIHVQKEIGKCDRVKDNYHYLPDDFCDCREELIQEMVRIIDLSKGGTVLVYNKTFESQRLKELQEIFPKYQKELENIRSHLYDLKDVIKGVKTSKVNYYHPKLDGSYSIKKVLPLFSQLSYHNLDIKNGIEAVVAYSKFKTLGKEDIKKLKSELIEYCGLDTYSMVVILDNLQERIVRKLNHE